VGSARRNAAAYTGQHKQNKRGQTSMPRMGVEPTIPVFERANTVHTLDRAATVIGISTEYCSEQTRKKYFIPKLLHGTECFLRS
jgi:hypothetical protein